MWKSSSTLLQVLISIQVRSPSYRLTLRADSRSQAMILGSSFPYYNEPGYGAPKDGKQNKGELASVMRPAREDRGSVASAGPRGQC